MIVKINNKKYINFKDYQIDLMFNAIADTFKFTMQDNILEKTIFFPNVEVRDDNGNLLIFGIGLPSTLKSSPKKQPTVIQGYSRSGVIEDSHISVLSYPLQFDGLTLNEIAMKVLKPFAISHTVSEVVKDDMNKVYDKVEAKPDETVKQFLNKLANERNIILSHRPTGNVLFTRKDVANLKSVGDFSVGKHGIKSMSLQFNGQKMHNPIYVIGQAGSDESDDAIQAEIANPYVLRIRTKVVVIDSANEFDADKAVRNELGKEIGTIKLTFESTIFNWPGSLIMVKNPEISLDVATPFFIEKLTIKGAYNKDDTYIYTCVPRAAYTDEKVKNMFK